MKRLFLLSSLLVAFAVHGQTETQQVLSSTQGHYVLGMLESGAQSVGGVSKSVYLVDTKTGAVWKEGCIAWDQSDKCIQFGLRTLGISDGAGGKIFGNAKDASEAKAFGSVLNDRLNKK